MHTLARTAVTGMGKAANQKELVEIIFWISNLHQFLCILESLKLRESAKPNNLGPLNAITSSQEAVYDILEDELLPVLFDNLGRDIASLASSAVLNGIDLHLYRNENNRNTFTNMFLMGGRVVANTAQQQLASSDGLMRLNICLTTVNRVLKDCLVPPELRERMLLQMLKGVGEGGTKALLEMRGGLSPAVARHVLVNVDVIVGWYGGIGMGSAKRHVANIKEVCAITLMRKRLPEDADSVISAGKLLGAAQVSTLLETCFDTRGEEELGMTEEFIEVLKNRVSKATQANRVCEEGDEGDMSMFVAPIDHCDTTVPPMITLPAGIKSLFVK
ncbi:hypothetical protein BC830DRAFT_766890 [Chytriomyces sp. MP71]|nr:hypothetical protein BC830DRAFT_766890 [Chytriomyces sp. MP71]